MTPRRSIARHELGVASDRWTGHSAVCLVPDTGLGVCGGVCDLCSVPEPGVAAGEDDTAIEMPAAKMVRGLLIWPARACRFCC